MKKKGWRFKNKEIVYVKEILDTDISPVISMNEKLEKKFAKFIIKNMQ